MDTILLHGILINDIRNMRTIISNLVDRINPILFYDTLFHYPASNVIQGGLTTNGGLLLLNLFIRFRRFLCIFL